MVRTTWEELRRQLKAAKGSKTLKDATPDGMAVCQFWCYINGKKEPGADTLCRIADSLGLDVKLVRKGKNNDR